MGTAHLLKEMMVVEFVLSIGPSLNDDARAPFREDRTVKGRAYQAPMKSHLARCQGDPMADKSTQ
jgi:hypothetical protein